MVQQDQNISDLQLKLIEKIIHLIKENSLSPGMRLREAALADQFKVSRSPIRSALMFLANLGIVEQRFNRGFFILKAVDDDVIDLPCAHDDKVCEKISRDWFDQKIARDISATEIRRRYKLGRVTASHILQKLSDQGIISRRPGYGWRFEPTLDSITAHDQSYDYRIIVETAAIELSTFKLNEGVAKNMMTNHRAFIDAMDQWVLSSASKMDADFHNFIASCSGNQFIIHTVERQNKLRYLLDYVSPVNQKLLNESYEEHIEILISLLNRDYKKAAALMREHLNKAKRIKPSYSK